MSLFFRILVVLAVAFASLPARAQATTQTTLDKIREYRAIYVGHRELAVPFAYMVGDEPVGYSMEICDRIVEAIKEAIGDSALRVVKVPVTTSSRFLMLRAGTVDLECGSTTNTKIRQQLVAFGLTTFVSGVKAVVRRDSPIRGISDMDGKMLVTTAGTTTDRLVQAALAPRKLTVRARSGRSHTESLAMVAAGQADVFVADEALLAGLVAGSPHGDQLRLLEDNFGFEPYAITLRKDDPEFKKLVDASLRAMMASGELERIYNKWFMSPIPPKGINLNIPMSGLLKELIRNPNDEGN